MSENIIKKFKGKLWLIFKTSSAERRHALVGPPNIWKMERDFQIQFLRVIGLQPTHYLLDLGCGTLRGGIPIIEHLQIGHYYGVEVRKNVLLEAEKELKETKLTRKQPTLILTSDIKSLNINIKFDIIWAFDVLYILSDKKLQDVLYFSKKHLKKTGCFYGNAKVGERINDYWNYGFPSIQQEVNYYRSIAQLQGLITEDRGTIESLGLGTGQKNMMKKEY